MLSHLALACAYMFAVTAILSLAYTISHQKWLTIQTIVSMGVDENSTVFVSDAYIADKRRRWWLNQLDTSFTLLIVLVLFTIGSYLLSVG